MSFHVRIVQRSGLEEPRPSYVLFGGNYQQMHEPVIIAKITEIYGRFGGICSLIKVYANQIILSASSLQDFNFSLDEETLPRAELGRASCAKHILSDFL